jgi:hypothetical protein
MSANPFPTPVREEEFRADAVIEPGRLVLQLWGNADLRVKDKLDDFLGGADAHATSSGLEEVVADLRQLAFMNSSCLKALATWLSRVHERVDGERYRIRFLRDPAAQWQARSLPFLAKLGTPFVTVE